MSHVGPDVVDGYDTAITFVIEASRVSRIYAIRNPARLRGIDTAAIISR